MVAELATAVAGLRERLQEKELECTVQGAFMADVQAEQESCRNRVIETLNAISHARGHLGKLDETLASHDRQLALARQKAETASAQQERALELRDGLAEQLGELQERVAAKSAGLEQRRQAAADRVGELETLRKSAEELRPAVSRLVARRDSLRQMLEHRAYTTDAVKDIFDALEKRPRPEFKPLGVLADFLEVDAGYEKAIEQFLGDDLETIVVGDWSQADCGVQLVREEFGGRAAFLVQSVAAGPPPGALPGSDEAEPLTNHVRLLARDGAAAPAWLPKLRDCYLVPDAAVAQQMAQIHPDLHFLLRNGAWYSGNTVQAGRKASSGPLVLKQQLRELAPQIGAAEQSLAALERSIEGAEEAVRREGAELEVARSSLQSLEKETLAAEHELQQSERTLSELQRMQTEAAGEIRRSTAERAKCETQRERVLTQRAKLEAVYAEAEARSSELVAKGRAGQVSLERLQEERTALRTDAATLDERQNAAQAAASSAAAQLAEQRERRERAESQIQQWKEESERLHGDNQGLDAKIVRAAERQGTLRSSIEAAAERLKESRKRTTALLDAVRAERAEVEKARGRCSAKEVELARVRSDRDHLAADCDTEVGQSIESVAEQVPADLPAEALQEAEERYLRVKDEIERLGPVNILARQEYEEVSQRREFLETQQQDLLDSIGNTRTAIKEIDTASREKFDAVFEAVNGHFRNVFATLFGGGVGEMRLTDPDNREESGIDIVAQPPGKRLQNVALLSGGEKSLTVMALLMATFRYKPSPFCVLDEVDSQLDEANTVRLRRLLQAMAPETQFLVITHSKSTMEVAETLYGVTMGEAGVSKLVSVRMAQTRAVEDREAPILAVGA